MSKKIKIYNYILFFVLSLFLTVFFVGIENFWFNQTSWLYGSGDLTNAQLSWQFFQNDVWRFPIGKNPNYGLEIANSIIFTDNIPIFAIVFKILKPFIYKNFQYFSLWIFLCFFLQILIGFKLIEKITKDYNFSFFSSLLLLLTPFLLFRLTHHFSLGAHWIILYSLYIAYFIPADKQKSHWYFVILISLMTHLYFTVMIFVIYIFNFFENLYQRKSKKVEIKNLLLKIIFALLIMYILGYFESHPINAVSSGYGIFKIDIFSFFDPQLDNGESWSLLLPNLAGTHLEGFTYLGLGNILLIFLSIIIFFGKKFLHINQTLTFQILRPLNLCFVLFIIWALTTNISILGIEIISVNLPKYLFAILSIFSSTGRFAWPFIYFMIIVSIFFLYRSFSKKVSFSIIISLICIQLLDISFKIFNNSLNEKKSHAIKSNDEIWKTIDDEFKIIRTTFLFNNYGPLFSNFSKILGELENIKTDIILNAAMDRKKAAQVRYNLIENINNEKLPTDTAYIIDNLGHLKQLKKQFSEKNYGFLFRDNFWMVLPGKKELMNSLDINNFNKIKINEMELNKKYNLRFKDDFLGFGWTHNFSKQGVWSEGKNSFLLFKKPPSKKKLELEINFLPYKGNKLENFSTKIFVNKQIYDEINLQKENQIKVVFEDNLKSSEIFIKFEFNNIISPFDILESPDARRLGILLKSIKINEI